MGNARIGVYFCACGGEINEAVSLDSLAEETAGLADVAVVRRARSLCSPPELSSIQADINERELDRLVIAACSPFLKEQEFAGLGLDRNLIERVNIREQCSRIHDDNPDHATRKARMLLQMSVAKARLAKPARKANVSAVQTVLVVGGGVTGINAAIDLAGTGVEVLLVEKTPKLGGKVLELHKYFPRMCPPSCGLELMIRELEATPRVHVLTSTEIANVTGPPGRFSVSLRTVAPDANGSQEGVPAIEVTVGAIVVATGWELFDPAPLAQYGYGRIRNVITNLDFERLSREDRSFLREPMTTAFIQCVGSRDERHLRYCSEVCCNVSIKQALLLKEENPKNEVYVFYNDIRTPGEYEELYRRARLRDVVFIKGIPSELRQETAGKIDISVFDTVAAERRDMTVGRVVLATGMKPSTDALKDATGLVLNGSGYIESHLQCFPQDSRRAGIFAAGCCRAPMDVARSIESAGAAAIKAVRLLRRESEISGLPDINLFKCDRCKRCIQECPFDAYGFDESGFPEVDAMRCRQCGICMGSCPVGAISVGETSIEQFSSMLDALDTAWLGADEPVVLGLLCKNDAYRAADDARSAGFRFPPNFVGLMLPCSGAVNGAIVAEAISKGIDGVLVAGCPDVQCHYVQGSELARARLADISDKLKEMYLEPERVRFASIERDDSGKLCEAIETFVRELKTMGRNPLRIAST